MGLPAADAVQSKRMHHVVLMRAKLWPSQHACICLATELVLRRCKKLSLLCQHKWQAGRHVPCTTHGHGALHPSSQNGQRPCAVQMYHDLSLIYTDGQSA